MKQRPKKKHRSTPAAKPAPAQPPAYPPTWLVFLSIAVIIWVARYWQCADFGFYEDDAARIPGGMEMSFTDLLEVYRSQMMMESQGRPLHDGLIMTFSFLIGHVGGLLALYVFGFLVVTMNGCLAYLLLRRLNLGPLFAVLGTLVWILYPVDTNSQLYLTLTLSGQFTLTFFLLATLAWLAGRRTLAYCLIGACLLCYETVVPVFFAVPLLTLPWDRRIIKPLALHSAIIIAMIAGIGILRTLLDATVIATPSLERALTWPFRQMAIGVYTALTTLFTRPISQLFASRAGHWFALAPLGVAILFAISETKDSTRETRQLLRSHGRIALIGLAMLALSYPLAFTSAAETVHGRGTRVHMPGVVGATFIAGALFSAMVLVARLRSGRLLAEVMLAVFFTGMAAFAWKIQDDYILSWDRQRAFWADAIRLCPDIGDGDLMLVDRRNLLDDGEIQAIGWAIMYTPALLFQIPDNWRFPPVAAYLRDDWRYAMRYERPIHNYINWAGQDAKFSQYKNSDFIILDVVEGELVRYTEPIQGNPGVLKPKPLGDPVLTRLPRRRLHSFLALRPGEVPADYTK